MRTRLTALLVAIAVVALGAAPASAAQLTGRSHDGYTEAFGASSNITVKDKSGYTTSYTWKDKGKDGGHWSKDKKDKDRSECVCEDDHKDKSSKGHKDKSKKDKSHKGKGHKGKGGWHWDGKDKCRDHEVPGTPDDGGETPDTEVPDEETPDTETPDEETPDTETPDTEVPDEETPDTETPDTETPDTETPDTDVVDDGGVLDSGVTAPAAPPVPAVAGGAAPAATPVVAEPTFAG